MPMMLKIFNRFRLRFVMFLGSIFPNNCDCLNLLSVKNSNRYTASRVPVSFHRSLLPAL